MIRRNIVALGGLAVLALCALAPADQKLLYEKVSPYNAITVTENDHGLRTLLFDKTTVQSVVKVGDPDHVGCAYARAMPVGLALVEQPRRVLVVGLGGGMLPNFLHKHYPRTTIDVVDIDPDVVDVAKRFFGFREDATLHAHVKDGRQFIEECREPYDIIFLDAFGSENIPYHLATREFLQAVRRALSAKGIAVANVWSRESNLLYDSMVRTYQDVFDELYLFEVRTSGNRIFVALPRQQRLEQGELARRARRISAEKGFRFDLGDLVVNGFHRAAEKDLQSRVLLDADKKTQ